MSSSKESTPSSESPERQEGVRGRRGRARGGRSRGVGRGVGRGGRRRVRGGQPAAETRGEQAFRIIESRKTRLRGMVQDMDPEKVRAILVQLVESHPSLIFNVLEPATVQPGGYHPPQGSSYPDWCVCGHCREMPTEMEKVCCGFEQCISLLQDFQVLVLDESVLAIAKMYRQDVLVFVEDEDYNKSNRHAAYRQFILWQHGRLGAGQRRVIPSCCVWKIRDKYPDPFSQYTGFIPSRLG